LHSSVESPLQQSSLIKRSLSEESEDGKSKSEACGCSPSRENPDSERKKLLTASKCNQVIPKIHFDLKNRITRISNEVDAKKMLEN
jgi:hypothetical protein